MRLDDGHPGARGEPATGEPAAQKCMCAGHLLEGGEIRLGEGQRNGAGTDHREVVATEYKRQDGHGAGHVMPWGENPFAVLERLCERGDGAFLDRRRERAEGIGVAVAGRLPVSVAGG